MFAIFASAICEVYHCVNNCVFRPPREVAFFIVKQQVYLYITIYFCVMEVIISINKEDVMPEVYKITGYTGVKSNDMDGISSTEDDDSILQSYLEEAASNLSGIISGESSSFEISTDSITYTLLLPANWKQGVKPALQKSMSLYIINFVCMQWFNLSKKDDVTYYSSLCENVALAVKKHLCERNKPQRV